MLEHTHKECAIEIERLRAALIELLRSYELADLDNDNAVVAARAALNTISIG